MNSRYRFSALTAAAAVIALAAGLPAAAATDSPRPASAASSNIVGTAMGSPQHRTLVAAVQAAGLVEALSAPGPLTVFAPTDAAFARLPAGTVDTLLQPENREQLRAVLGYHVVAGRVTAADLVRMIRAGRGSAQLTTLQGGVLTARLSGSSVVLTDGRGGTATVTAADLVQSNGVIHVTDAVSLPG